MTSTRRRVAPLLLALGLVAVAVVVLFGGPGGYVIHAEFYNAGQLVTGDRVEVWGVPVGTVSDLRLTPNGLADVTLAISSESDTPMHAGTQAVIRAPGLASVAARYVDLEPGPLTAPALPSGSTLSIEHTSGIVDIDELLDAVDRPTRQSVQHLIANSAQIFAGSGARYFNQLLARLSPALAQTAELYGQLSTDRVGLRELISTAEATTTALASRDGALQQALTNSARALGAVAREQQPLSDALQRLPAVLRDGTDTLNGLRPTITALIPTLRDVPAAAGPLASVLVRLPPTADAAEPVLAATNRLLPSLDATLTGLAPLRPRAVPALGATATALQSSLKMFTGLRYYGPDFLEGFTNGLGGVASGNYDENGHYGRIEFVNAPQTALAGLLSQVLPSGTILPNSFGIREHLVARCPGGAAPPAPDGSNPVNLDPFWCNPADDVPLSVDSP